MKKKNLYRSIFVSFVLLFTSLNLSAGNGKLIHDKTFDAKSGEQLEIKADFGDIKVQSGSSDIIEVKIYGNSRTEDNVDFYFEETSKGLRIIAEKEGGSWGSWFSSYKLKFEIQVPSEFDLRLTTAGGDIYVTEIDGQKLLGTSGGDIKIAESYGKVKASTSGGDVDVKKHSGNCEVSTSGGDIKIEKLVGSIKASTSGGDIRIQSAEGEIEAGTSGGDIILDYHGENFGIGVSTTGGDVTLRIPSDFIADLDLRTSGGDIETDVSGVRADRISSSKFYGSMNGGGELVKLRTTGGDIKLKEKR